MKIAILSDIHSNIYALNSVLDDISSRGIKDIYCLGDLVGYNTKPNEVLNKIRTLNIPCVLGNHDENVILWDKSSDNLVIKYMHDNIDSTNMAYLKQLPKNITINIAGKSILLTHGSPNSITEYIQQNDIKKQMELATVLNQDAIIFGHTHDYYHKVVNNKIFINAGSVGRMKDGDNRACYTIIDENLNAEFIRVNYNFEDLVDEILNSNLPNKFANVIKTGIDI